MCGASLITSFPVTRVLLCSNDILDYSKLSAGRFTFNDNDFSISETVQAVVKGVGSTPNVVELSATVDGRIPSYVCGDSLRTRQVFQNIIGNAVKFTDYGNITTTVRLLESESDRLTILAEVRDTGIGIDAAVATSLFTPFVQVDNSLTKRFPGTGLGLSISKHLVGLMGGNIGYFPNPDGGSVFWFTLKFKQSRHVRVDVGGVDPHVGLDLGQLTAGKRILLVEDNPINQKVMHKMLTSLGFAVVKLASDGKQGVDMFFADDFDLVFMDINMPVLVSDRIYLSKLSTLYL